jgi:hypothetical protein
VCRMTIYSVLLAAGTVTGGTNPTVFTAPAAGVVVVRDIEVAGLASATGPVAFQVYSGSIVSPIYKVHVDDTFMSYHWEGRQVLAPGDLLRVQALDGSVYYRISGYLLGV